MTSNTDTVHPTLLLVDDDLTFCRVLGRALEKRGFETYIATDLHGALELAGDHNPEYAVIDLRLGNESGLEVVKQLKAMGSNVRMVILTGYASIATAVEAIKLGATHYLTKPASADEIICALGRDSGDTGVTPAENPLSIKRLEWEYLQKVLLENNGNISATARALGMHRRTLQRKLAKKPVRS